MSTRSMHKKFDRIYEKARRSDQQIPFDPKTDKLVIISDHHKGDGSKADDFKKNANLYKKALDHYEKHGYRLIVIGDNEELWENNFNRIILNYREIIKKEIELALIGPNGKKIRIWGNHDKEVSLPRFTSYCGKQDFNHFDNIDQREGICLGKDIFLIHGHQGRFFDDKAWRFSRWVVHFVWKTFQKIFHIGRDGPAENYKIRSALELSYYKWAKKNKIILICGHTHRAVFASLTHLDRKFLHIKHLKNHLKEIPLNKKREIEKKILDTQIEINELLTKQGASITLKFESPPTPPIPCYFNDGCCGYTNGLTCLEIQDNNIRLVKWNLSSGKKTLYASQSLPLLLSYIREVKSIDKDIEPELF